MIYALIKNGSVENSIVAEPEFLPLIEANFDAIVDITEMSPQPALGWLYDGETFTDPNAEEPEE